MVGDGDAEVGDRHQDGQAELAHQQAYQARLKKHGIIFELIVYDRSMIIIISPPSLLRQSDYRMQYTIYM